MNTAEKREWLLLGSLFVVAGVLRLFYWNVFFGWEESDYGNLAMVQGVLDSGFTAYDMNHMPGFYAIGAFLLSLIGDTVIASKSAAWLGGMTSFALTIILARHLSGMRVAVVVGLLLIIQPEFSLYSASALREPLYSAFLLGLVYSYLRNKWWLAGIMALLAFSIRFEAPLACCPIMAFLFLRRKRRVAIGSFVGFSLGVFLWALYCYIVYETPQFWSHAAGQNVETGLGMEATSTWEWIQNGFGVVMSLLFELLPSRVGWLVFIGWFLAPFLIDVNSKMMIPVVMSFGLVAVWLAIGFISQHEPNHNLYWKWLMPFVPLMTWVGVTVFGLIVINWRRYMKVCSWGALIIQASLSHVMETQSQLKRAERLYRPQVELANLIECNDLTDRSYLIDNIPERWLRRKPTELSMMSWHDLELSENSPAVFAEWLKDNNVAAVLWFRESWTKAPEIAPFLGDGQTWTHDELILEPTRKDLDPAGYGWVFYERLDGNFKRLPNCD